MYEGHFGDDGNRIKGGTHAWFDISWSESTALDAQIMEYTAKYTRVDGKKSVLQLRAFLYDAAAHPITGYALNSYSTGNWKEIKRY